MTTKYLGYTGIPANADLDALAADAAAGAAAYAVAAAAEASAAAANTFIQAGTGAIVRTPQNKAREWVSVKDFGANGTGGDDTAAFQAAANALVATGGEIRVPVPGRYGLASQVLVKSKYPIHFVSEMGAVTDIASSGVYAGSYIFPMNNISGSLIRYESPTATRGDAGGGTVRGLTFLDASNLSAVSVTARRQYTMTAAVDFYDAPFGRVMDCYFSYLKGSAIRTNFWVMGSISGGAIRYCGAPSKPAIYVSSTDATYYSQSGIIKNIPCEVNFDAEYIQLDARSRNIKVRSVGFESDSVANPTSGQTFLNDLGTNNSYNQNHFNRTSATALVTGNYGKGTLNEFEGHTGLSVQMAGVGGRLTANSFYANIVEQSVAVAGTSNSFVGNTLGYSGGIEPTGNQAMVDENNIYEPQQTSGYVLDYPVGPLAGSCANNTIRFAVLSSTVGGIRSSTGYLPITGNKVYNALVGIYLDTTTNTVSQNNVTSCTTPIDGIPNFWTANTLTGNPGWADEACGIAFVPNGSTFVVFAHGLPVTPSLRHISVCPADSMGAAVKCYIDGITSTDLTVKVDVNPGIVSGAGIAWRVRLAG